VEATRRETERRQCKKPSHDVVLRQVSTTAKFLDGYVWRLDRSGEAKSSPLAVFYGSSD
jgi:hypothetical protein